MTEYAKGLDEEESFLEITEVAKGPEAEEQLFLRLPPAFADRIHSLLRTGVCEEPFGHVFDSERHGRLILGHLQMPSVLVDLPTHIESFKTHQNSVICKSCDVHQMLWVFDEQEAEEARQAWVKKQRDNEEAVRKGRKVKPFVWDGRLRPVDCSIDYMMHSGLTKSTANVAKRQFRPIKVNPAYREISQQMEALRKGVAETDVVELEVLDYDDMIKEIEERRAKAARGERDDGQGDQSAEQPRQPLISIIENPSEDPLLSAHHHSGPAASLDPRPPHSRYALDDEEEIGDDDDDDEDDDDEDNDAEMTDLFGSEMSSLPSMPASWSSLGAASSAPATASSATSVAPAVALLERATPSVRLVVRPQPTAPTGSERFAPKSFPSSQPHHSSTPPSHAPSPFSGTTPSLQAAASASAPVRSPAVLPGQVASPMTPTADNALRIPPTAPSPVSQTQSPLGSVVSPVPAVSSPAQPTGLATTDLVAMGTDPEYGRLMDQKRTIEKKLAELREELVDLESKIPSVPVMRRRFMTRIDGTKSTIAAKETELSTVAGQLEVVKQKYS